MLLSTVGAARLCLWAQAVLWSIHGDLVSHLITTAHSCANSRGNRDEPGKWSFKACCVLKPRQFLPEASPEAQSTAFFRGKGKVCTTSHQGSCHFPSWHTLHCGPRAKPVQVPAALPICISSACSKPFPPSPVTGVCLAPDSLPIHLSWKVTAHRTQPDSLILLAPSNSLSPKALKLQILLCSLSCLPRCDIQHLPLF